MTNEELLAKYGKDNKIKVLDEYGHVFVVDTMGGDERIEQVARLSYEGGRKSSDTRALLRYLLRHRHTSPFEQAVITLDIKLPIFVARQLIRHRTQSLNELSARYSKLPEEFYVPPLDQVCYQSEVNNQGRSGPFPVVEAEQLQNQMIEEGDDAFATYNQFLEAGMAKETARMGLPLSTYTHWVTTWDLHNLMHMLGLRLDPHAQWEIRMYAEAIWKIVKDWCPITAEAFVDYRLEAKTFSKQEMSFLQNLVEEWKEDMEALAESENSPTEQFVRERVENRLILAGITNKREQQEFLNTLRLS